MRLQVDISSEAESKLREQASRVGVSPEEFARRLVEQGLSANSTNGASTNGTASNEDTQRNLKAWQEWFASHKPLPILADDSRESIYEGRGE